MGKGVAFRPPTDRGGDLVPGAGGGDAGGLLATPDPVELALGSPVPRALFHRGRLLDVRLYAAARAATVPVWRPSPRGHL